MSTIKVTTKTGESFEISSNRKNITGIICFKNDGEWAISITTVKDPAKRCEQEKNISGRDWLSEFHLASFEILN